MKEPIYKSLYEYVRNVISFGEDKKGIQNPSNLKGLRSHLLN